MATSLNQKPVSNGKEGTIMNNTALADISRTTRHQLPWQAGKLIGQGASADVYAVIDQATGKESADCMKVICTNQRFRIHA